MTGTVTTVYVLGQTVALAYAKALHLLMFEREQKQRLR